MKKSTIIFITSLVLVCVIAGAFAAKYLAEIVSSGSYAGNIALSPATINWGSVTQNVNVTQSIDITNHGDTATLAFLYTDPLGFDTTLVCDAEGYSLVADATVTANFTLTVHNGTAGAFNFKIYVEATTT